MGSQTKGEKQPELGRLIRAIRDVVGDHTGPLPLHSPTIRGKAWEYVKDCLDTAWVSSAGGYVRRFEEELASFTGASQAVAVVNGTTALHAALKLLGVERDDEVLLPSLTFVATANAIAHCGGIPHFVDVEERSLGMDPAALEDRLSTTADRGAHGCFNRTTGRRLAAILPMHTFGHPADLDGLRTVAERFGIPLVEDAAESLGSWYGERHTGTLGTVGILSFNGNKIVTTGGGGAILTDDPELAEEARHLTTTAKRAHPWEYFHDRIGYNYRMPNLNAALGCAQMEDLPELLRAKRRLARDYMEAFASVEGVSIFKEPPYARSNYWLNALILDRPDRNLRDGLLQGLAEAGIQARPVWNPMHTLPMFRDSPRGALPRTEDLADRIVNLPSSAHLRGL
jgi:perosamine synthetase